MLCVAILVAISVISYLNGDPKSLILPHDSQGNICGQADYADKKHLFFFDLTKCLSFLSAINGCPTRQICVSQCPSEYGYSQVASLAPKLEPFCDPVTKECPTYVIPSEPIFGRCVPKIIASLGDNLQGIVEAFDPDTNQTVAIEAFDPSGQMAPLTYQTLLKSIEYLKNFLNLKESSELIFEDFAKTYWLILAGMAAAALLCFIWIFALRFLIKPMVYCSFALTWLALSILFGLIFLILLVVTTFLRKQIKFAIALIKEVSKAVVDMPSVLVWPLVPLVIQTAFIVYCLTVSVYLASSGIKLYKVVDTNNSFVNVTERVVSQVNVGDYCIPELFDKTSVPDSYECFFYKFGFNTTLPFGVDSAQLKNYYTFFMQAINEYQWVPQVYVVFMLFWLVAFSVALNQMTLGGAFGAWFFSRHDKMSVKKLPFVAVIGSFWRAVFYHLGTVAFGSLLIALLKLVRLFLEFLSSKAKQSENKAAKYTLKCMKCCFWCLERLVKFLNRRVFIITATYSLSFCSAAKRAVEIITRNILRVLVLNKLSDFVLFISNLCITFVMAVLGFYVFTRKIPLDFLLEVTPELNFYVAPLAVLIIGSYCVSKLFLDVFSFGIDTILLCALIDFEENDGSREKPYFMSKSLK
ncbi:choline transporter 2, partial [Brachionus plicatilis]